MNETDTRVDGELLAREIARYLAVVDLFREVGCPPAWRPERRFERTASTDEFRVHPRSKR